MPRLLCLALLIVPIGACRDFRRSFEKRNAIERQLRPSEETSATDETVGLAAFDHSDLQKVLAAAVSADGKLNKTALLRKKKQLAKYLGSLAAGNPSQYKGYEWDALMINAFNACVLQLIAERPQASESRDVRKSPVWSEERFTLGGVKTDLQSLQKIMFDTFPHAGLKHTLYYGTDTFPPLSREPYQGILLIEQMKRQENIVSPLDPNAYSKTFHEYDNAKYDSRKDVWRVKDYER